MARKRKASSGRRRRSSGGVGQAFKIIALCGLVLALLGFVGWFGYNSTKGPKWDEATMCPASGPARISAILLDLTDPLSSTQSRRLQTELDQVMAGSPADTLFVVGVVSENPAEWGAQFAKCKPKSGAAANRLTENQEQVAERYETGFDQPLRDTLSRMMQATEANQSPIMEALQALQAEAAALARPGTPETLLIVSDLLQHSDVLSFYRGQGWQAFEQGGGANRIAGTLRGADVRLLQIPRAGGRLSQGDIDDFWVRYFDRQGARLPSYSVLGDL